MSLVVYFPQRREGRKHEESCWLKKSHTQDKSTCRQDESHNRRSLTLRRSPASRKSLKSITSLAYRRKIANRSSLASWRTSLAGRKESCKQEKSHKQKSCLQDSGAVGMSDSPDIHNAVPEIKINHSTLEPSK